jgi:hypothetical protein
MTMVGIFISYRREDSSGWAGRLHEALKRTFSSERVFFDIDSLEPGSDYADAINKSLELSAAALVIIGPRWLDVKDKKGDRRLDDPSDLTHIEVATALKHEITVIPVLVGEAIMPSADQLPEDLKRLAKINAYKIDDRRWEYDQKQLIRFLQKHIRTNRHTWIKWAICALAITGVMISFAFLLDWKSSNTPPIISEQTMITDALRINGGISGVLLLGKFRAQQQLNGMSPEDQRNTLITELAARTRDTVGFYQSLNNADLAGAGALLVYLRETGRTDQQIKTMNADDMRNIVIVEVKDQTHRDDLQALSNMELIQPVLGELIQLVLRRAGQK